MDEHTKSDKLNSESGVEDDFLNLFEACQLCPRQCGTNRLGSSKAARSGFCKENSLLCVDHVGAHLGEEPPITGSKGSGTIFFTGMLILPELPDLKGWPGQGNGY